MKTYDDINREIDDVYKRNEIKELYRVEKIYLPTEDFNIFKSETSDRKHSLTWWGIPVMETKGSDIYFILKNKDEL